MYNEVQNEEKISRKNSKLLWIGTWTSNVGNKIFDYANSILILSLGTKATRIMALYQSTETAISIIFNLFGGAVSDGKSKIKICIFTDFMSALICFVLATLVNSPDIGMIAVIANAILAWVGAFNSPTYKAIVREVIKKDKLISFNSITHGVNQALSLVAPVLGLYLVKYIGAKGALVIDGATFVVSGFLEMKLKPLSNYERQHFAKKKIFQEIRKGIRYIMIEKKILFLVVMSSCVNFFLAAYNLSLPFSEKIFGVGFYSKVLIAEAIGGIMGSFLCSLKKSTVSLKVMISYLGLSGLVLWSVPITIEIAKSNYVIFISIGLFSTFMTFYNVYFFTYVQGSVAQEFLGRVFSIINTVALFFVPLGALFFPLILEFDNLLSYSIAGIGIVSIAILALGVLKKMTIL